MKAIKASELAHGDTIHEGKKTIEVQSLTVGESCNGVHVNRSLCYDRSTTVVVTR